jgi:hypothetical protein
MARLASLNSVSASILSGPFIVDHDIPVYTGTYWDSGGTVEKVGRTTGWTVGYLTDHWCVDIFQSGNRILQCQIEAALTVNFGDSGSPIFLRVDAADTSNHNVRLGGIFWGIGAPGYAYFSAFTQIFGDFYAVGTNLYFYQGRRNAMNWE